MSRNRICWFCVVAGLILAAQAAVASTAGVYDVRDCGAAGDGATLDTPAIQKAVDTCAAAGGGQVRFAPGRYLSGTVHLKSHVTLFFEAGARLVGTTSLDQYQHPTPPAFLPEAKWGKWHRALILGDGLEDIAIAGQGVIDGNKVFDPTGEEKMRGPHTFVFVNCRGVSVRDVSFVDSANYAIFFQVSDEVDIRNVTFSGGWDGVHFRGGAGKPCRDVSIVGCRFFTGDDSIAGRYWENTLISDCVVNSSCNGVRLIGPATHLIIHDCLFYGPGVYPHRTSNRHNMLSGLNLQPGAWDATQGALDDVLISEVTMHNVSNPFHFTLKPGNTAGRIVVNRVTATGVYRAASSVESWADGAFTNVVFRDVTIECAGGGTKEQASMSVKSPGVDARALPAWGFYARNVDTLEFDNVRLRCEKEDLRPVLMCDGVRQLTLDGFRFRRSADAAPPLVLNNVGQLEIKQSDVSLDQPYLRDMKLASQDASDRFIAGGDESKRPVADSSSTGKPNILTLVQTIPLPGVTGRFDHFAIDAKGHRLFAAALGNNTLEVLDIAAGKRLKSIAGLHKPTGVLYLADSNQIGVANGDDGVFKLFDGVSYNVVKSLGSLDDADNVRFDPKTKTIYVGYGSGGIAVVDGSAMKQTGSVQLPAHPESFQLELHGVRVFVNVPDAQQIAVIDRQKQSVIATWPMTKFQANFPMALDEVNHRLFVGCRRPARLVVFDTTDSKSVTDLAISGDTDDLFYDAVRKRLYLSCGEGFLDVVAQRDADHYERIDRVVTAPGARTCFYSADLDRLWLAVPQQGGKPAEIRTYRPE